MEWKSRKAPLIPGNPPGQSVLNPTFDGLISELIRLLTPSSKDKDPYTIKEWCCWTERFTQIATADSFIILKNKINHIGFNRLKNAFELLNQACESALCEPEDLVGIYKRHVFKKLSVVSDTEKTAAILKYLDLTLINWIRLRKLNKLNISREFIGKKKKAARVISPLLFTLTDLLKSENMIG